MNVKKSFSFNISVPKFTIIFGLILIGHAVADLVRTESFIKRAVSTTGTVQETHQDIFGLGAAVTVEFHDNDGDVRAEKFETGSIKMSYKKGDSVKLLYDPADRISLYVGNPRHRRYSVAVLYIVLGGGLIFFTIRRLRKGQNWEKDFKEEQQTEDENQKTGRS